MGNASMSDREVSIFFHFIMDALNFTEDKKAL